MLLDQGSHAKATGHSKMYRSMLPVINRLLACLFLVAVAIGCKSRPLGPYVSPRVTGQVLAADTRQPLPGVRVRRVPPRSGKSPGQPPRGGELLLVRPPAETGADGTFTLASERVLSVVRGADWNVVSLALSRSGYRSFQTNCSARFATNSARGEPVLDVGQILLLPVSGEQPSSAPERE